MCAHARNARGFVAIPAQAEQGYLQICTPLYRLPTPRRTSLQAEGYTQLQHKDGWAHMHTNLNPNPNRSLSPTLILTLALTLT